MKNPFFKYGGHPQWCVIVRGALSVVDGLIMIATLGWFGSSLEYRWVLYYTMRKFYTKGTWIR
jgi:hypothetical protein